METVKFIADYGGHKAGEMAEIDLYGPDGADALAELGIVEIVSAPAVTESTAAESKPAAVKKQPTAKKAK